MSFFNKSLLDALSSGNYICSKCAAKMEFEDEMEDVLICPKCGHSVDLEHYGTEDDEDYYTLYSVTPDEINDVEEDDGDDEPYDEVCGELNDYVP